MDNNNLSIDCQLIDGIKLHPSQLHSQYLQVIDHKLREKLEGKCSKWGYIMYNSIRNIQLDDGFVEEQTTCGYINCNVRFQAYVVNPTPKSLVKCEVFQKAQKNIIEAVAGKWHPDGFEYVIRCYINPMLTMKHNDNINTVKVNDTIIVKILNSTFKNEKDHIQCVGLLHKKSAENDNINEVITEAPRTTSSYKLGQDMISNNIEEEEEEEDEKEDEKVDEDEEDEDIEEEEAPMSDDEDEKV